MAAGRPLASRQGLFASGERKPGKEEEGGRLSIGGSVVVVVEGGRKTDRPGSAYRLFDSIKNERPIRRGLQDTSAPLSATIILSLSLSVEEEEEEESFQDWAKGCDGPRSVMEGVVSLGELLMELEREFSCIFEVWKKWFALSINAYDRSLFQNFEKKELWLFWIPIIYIYL